MHAGEIQGTGLGMPITNTLVQLMGGTIKIQSTPNVGSTFVVDLIFTLADHAQDMDFWKRNGIERILVIDDEEEVCENIKLILKSVGVEVDYATDGYGFLCIPRNITERLVEKGHVFEETDAWLDLWCHTVFRDYGNVFSFLAPAVQYGKYGSVLTLDSLGKRWGWEKTKVWRFFRKFWDDFALYRLSSACGCVIYNLNYPSETEYTRPNAEHVKHIMELIRITARKTYYEGSENTKINRIIAWKSRKIIRKLRDQYGQNEYEEAISYLEEK